MAIRATLHRDSPEEEELHPSFQRSILDLRRAIAIREECCYGATTIHL